jgi:hypothetical protein
MMAFSESRWLRLQLDLKLRPWLTYQVPETSVLRSVAVRSFRKIGELPYFAFFARFFFAFIGFAPGRGMSAVGLT